ncbi:Hypothetical predicted protein [Paramuricea clavata]|uniref:Uncharacterized protein n=1 Tax=Paramuricea clavata TaxID=317549 RepID=A0A6S7HZB3_PARCT|nr:Hypothetical predicted protein [Paramuricea clavata]
MTVTKQFKILAQARFDLNRKIHMIQRNIQELREQGDQPILDQQSIRYEHTCKSGADNLATWASENRMAIHPDTKTKVMLVGTKRKLATIAEPLNISICGTTLSQSSSGKLLGIHMDDCLSWNEHISAVIKKFNTKL